MKEKKEKCSHSCLDRRMFNKVFTSTPLIKVRKVRKVVKSPVKDHGEQSEMAEKSIRDLLGEVGLDESFSAEETSAIVPTEIVEKFNSEANVALKAALIVKFLFENNAEAMKKKKDDEREANELARKKEEQMAKKFDRWAYPAFSQPDKKVYLSGKMEFWLRGFTDYVKTEKIDEKTAVKSLKFKSGDYIGSELAMLRDQAESVGDSSSQLQFMIDALRKKTAQLSDVFKQVRSSIIFFISDAKI